MFHYKNRLILQPGFDSLEKAQINTEQRIINNSLMNYKASFQVPWLNWEQQAKGKKEYFDELVGQQTGRRMAVSQNAIDNLEKEKRSEDLYRKLLSELELGKISEALKVVGKQNELSVSQLGHIHQILRAANPVAVAAIHKEEAAQKLAAILDKSDKQHMGRGFQAIKEDTEKYKKDNEEKINKLREYQNKNKVGRRFEALKDNKNLSADNNDKILYGLKFQEEYKNMPEEKRYQTLLNSGQIPIKKGDPVTFNQWSQLIKEAENKQKEEQKQEDEADVVEQEEEKKQQLQASPPLKGKPEDEEDYEGQGSAETSYESLTESREAFTQTLSLMFENLKYKNEKNNENLPKGERLTNHEIYINLKAKDQIRKAKNKKGAIVPISFSTWSKNMNYFEKTLKTLPYYRKNKGIVDAANTYKNVPEHLLPRDTNANTQPLKMWIKEIDILDEIVPKNYFEQEQAALEEIKNK